MPRSRKWCRACYESVQDVGTISARGLCKYCAVKRVVASLVASYPELDADKVAERFLIALARDGF